MITLRWAAQLSSWKMSLIDDMYLEELDRDRFQEILHRSGFSLPFELL
ncbi:MAG: hypothetical protein R6U17_04840 [Thermoplasmata archaeon]